MASENHKALRQVTETLQSIIGLEFRKKSQLEYFGIHDNAVFGHADENFDLSGELEMHFYYSNAVWYTDGNDE